MKFVLTTYQPVLFVYTYYKPLKLQHELDFLITAEKDSGEVENYLKQLSKDL
jgi:hypothetical protein